MPFVPAALHSALVMSSGNAGTVSGKYVHSHGTGSPASSQCPEGVSFPIEVSRATPQSAVGSALKPGVSIPVDKRIAAPRPSASIVGTCKPTCLMICPSVFAPVSGKSPLKKSPASGAPPHPALSRTIKNARAISGSPHAQVRFSRVGSMKGQSRHELPAPRDLPALHAQHEYAQGAALL